MRMPLFEVKDFNNLEVGQFVQLCKCSNFMIEVLSEKDNKQKIEFKLAIFTVLGEKLEERTSYSSEFYISNKYIPGSYYVAISPKTGSTYNDFKHINLGDSFKKPITLFGNRTSHIKVYISRKESILYNIPYDFIVGENPEANPQEPIHESEMLANLTQGAKFSDYYPFANDAANRFNVPLDLILSIAYIETTHGWYDVVLEPFGKNKSILPMNINVIYWDMLFTREEVRDVHQNFLAAAFLLRRIIDRCDKYNIRKISSLYNSINFTKVQDYGARVEQIRNIFIKKYVNHE